MTRLYSIKEAADVLNVPFTWLRDKVTARQVPHTRLGRHVRFTEAHLAQIVAEGERQVAAAAAVSLTGRRRRRRAS
jgi:excisionase family DNA binding protein